ncbi:MAG: hypothetical protein QW331_00845 [Candidatus Woesearchaeota archaeon]
MRKKLLPFLLMPLLLLQNAMAHCPLCVVGAAVAVGGAKYFGVSTIIIGLFTGAFAASVGYWVALLIKKQYLSFQKTAIILFSFLTTIIPLMSMFDSIYPFPVLLFGDYGSLLNRTYLLNVFLVGSTIGGIIVCITPSISRKITAIRGKLIPFQGVLLTFFLLAITAAVMQWGL